MPYKDGLQAGLGHFDLLFAGEKVQINLLPHLTGTLNLSTCLSEKPPDQAIYPNLHGFLECVSVTSAIKGRAKLHV
jgi:hypothetical protein